MKLYNFERPENCAEFNSQKSMTFPDMSVSISELVKSYQMGTLPTDFVRDVLYDDCDDFDSVLANYAPGYDLVDKSRELSKLRQKFEAMHSPGVGRTESEEPASNFVEDKPGEQARADESDAPHGGALS